MSRLYTEKKVSLLGLNDLVQKKSTKSLCLSIKSFGLNKLRLCIFQNIGLVVIIDAVFWDIPLGIELILKPDNIFSVYSYFLIF